MEKVRERRSRHCVKPGQSVAILMLAFVAVGYGQTPAPSASLGSPLEVLSPLVDSPKDSTEAIQKLLDEKEKAGGKVLLPPGRFVIAGQLNIPTSVTLEGSWGGSVHYLSTHKNTVLMMTGRKGIEDFAGKGAIHLNASSGLRGLTIAYPDQKFPEVAPYPWTITGDGYAICIENIVLVNSYQGIRLGYSDSTLHYVRNVFGTVLRRGLWIDNCWDIGRIENIHFNVIYWADADLPNKVPDGLPNMHQVLANYTRKHLEAFILNKTDWGILNGTFVYGAKIGYRFPAKENGGFNGRMIGVGADGCIICMSFENSNPYGIQISDGTFAAHLNYKSEKELRVKVEDGELQSNVILTTPSANSPIQFSNCSFFGYPAHIALLEGEGFTTFNQCLFRGWDCKKEGAAAIHALNGKLGVSHSQFLEWPGTTLNSVYLGKNVGSAKIMGNLSTSKVRINSQIGKRAAIDAND